MAGKLDKYDRRLLTAFQHWQPILHAHYSSPTYIRSRYRFFDPLRNATFDSVYVNHHVLATAARARPECSKFARMRIPPFGSVRATLAAGFPGSGNFWFFNMFHYLTGLATENRPCSICDRNVVVPSHMSPIADLDAGYGNKEENVNFVRPMPSLAHRLRELRTNGGRMLLIMRNPYEAIISWWNHLRSMDAGGAGLGVKALKNSLESDQFCKFAVGEAKLWRQLNLDVLTLSTELFVVHYQDMVKDSIGKMLEVLKFLKVPENRARTECTKVFGPRKPRTTGKNLDEGKSPFCEEAKTILDKAIVEVERVLKDTGRPLFDRSKFKYHSTNKREEL